MDDQLLWSDPWNGWSVSLIRTRLINVMIRPWSEFFDCWSVTVIRLAFLIRSFGPVALWSDMPLWSPTSANQLTGPPKKLRMPRCLSFPNCWKSAKTGRHSPCFLLDNFSSPPPLCSCFLLHQFMLICYTLIPLIHQNPPQKNKIKINFLIILKRNGQTHFNN